MFIQVKIGNEGKYSEFTLVDMAGVSLKEQAYFDRN